MSLAPHIVPRHNASVPFNSGTGLGGPNSKADSRLAAIFTSVRNTIGTSSMPSRGGRALALAGSLLPVRQSCYVLGTPLGGEVLSLTLSKEATMPGIILRALSRLFPITRRFAFALYRRRAISALTLVRLIGGAA